MGSCYEAGGATWHRSSAVKFHNSSASSIKPLVSVGLHTASSIEITANCTVSDSNRYGTGVPGGKPLESNSRLSSLY